MLDDRGEDRKVQSIKLGHLFTNHLKEKKKNKAKKKRQRKKKNSGFNSEKEKNKKLQYPTQPCAVNLAFVKIRNTQVV